LNNEVLTAVLIDYDEATGNYPDQKFNFLDIPTIELHITHLIEQKFFEKLVIFTNKILNNKLMNSSGVEIIQTMPDTTNFSLTENLDEIVLALSADPASAHIVYLFNTSKPIASFDTIERITSEILKQDEYGFHGSIVDLVSEFSSCNDILAFQMHSDEPDRHKIVTCDIKDVNKRVTLFDILNNNKILHELYPLECEIACAKQNMITAMDLTYQSDTVQQIEQVSKVIINCFKSGGKLILFGNGGSAADSQHIAAEFVVKLRENRTALPAIALTTDTSVLTAIANDFDFRTVFARQIEAVARPLDVVIGLSTSGKSKNVLFGLQTANRIGAHTVLLTGKTVKSKKFVDTVISVASSTTSTIQEMHIQIGHLICAAVEREFFNG